MNKSAPPKASSHTASSRKVSKKEFETLADFRYQVRRYLRFSEEVSRGLGITSLQYLLLLQIVGFPGRDWANIGELAERLQAKHHGVVSLVSRCEALGLVRRSVSASDKRQVEVHLTRKGGDCVTRLAALHRRELVSLKGRFTMPVLTASRGAARRWRP